MAWTTVRFGGTQKPFSLGPHLNNQALEGQAIVNGLVILIGGIKRTMAEDQEQGTLTPAAISRCNAGSASSLN